MILALFSLLQILDAALTYRVLREGGTEAWKPTAWAIKRFGLVPALIAYKGGIILLAYSFNHFHGGSQGCGQHTHHQGQQGHCNQQLKQGKTVLPELHGKPSILRSSRLRTV